MGDTDYCLSPISDSLGAILSIVGVYGLAGEIDRCSTHETAFVEYENMIRPLC